jgi:hypothetical protein
VWGERELAAPLKTYVTRTEAGYVSVNVTTAAWAPAVLGAADGARARRGFGGAEAAPGIDELR